MKRSEEFAYEDSSLNFLSARNSISLRQDSPGSRLASPSLEINVNSGIGHNSWFDINYLAFNLNSQTNCDSFSVGQVIAEAEGSRSLGQCTNDLGSDDSDQCFGFDSGERKSASSTRLDFLDVNSIISVSPTCISDTSDMGLSDNEGEKGHNSKKCSCSEGITCATCATVTGEQLSEALNKALQKIDFLSNKF